MLWQNGKFQDFNTLISTGTMWNLEEAFSINNAGQILGVGEVDSRYSTSLLTPVLLP